VTEGARNRAFVLGVGAQKAGTTWLSRYLRSFRCCDMGVCEEYHVWDALALPACAKYLISERDGRSRADEVRARMQRDEAFYFRYFAGLLGRWGIRVTGDITPAYSGLPGDVYARIVRGFGERGIDVKAVLLIRDPLERCWSAVRMHRRKGRDWENAAFGLGEEEALRAYCASEQARLRTRYDLTIRGLHAALPEDRVHVGVYESMFVPAGIEALSRFLGVPARPERGGTVVNRTEKQAELPEALQAMVAREYAEVYAFCAERYPETRTLWRGFRYL
jgi:hypothetical protein